MILSCVTVALLRKEEVCPVRMGDPRPENSVLSSFPNGRIFSWRQEGSVKGDLRKRLNLLKKIQFP